MKKAKKIKIPVLINRLTGRYILSVPREHAVRMLNAQKNAGIVFWGAYYDEDKFYICVSPISYGGSLRAAKKAELEPRTEKAVGLAFLLYKYRNRLGLAVGALLAALLVFAASLFVWDIQVTGNVDIPAERIKGQLSAVGVYEGAFIPFIRVNPTRMTLVMNMPELSSAAVNINGTYITVDVVERARPPERENTAGYYNVVAAEDGVIVSMEAFAGKPAVKAGDTVTAGQLLISGDYISFHEKQILTHARGCVKAAVQRQFVTSIPLAYAERRYTGDSVEKSVMTLLGKDIRLFLGSAVPYEDYDITVTNEDLKLLFLKLPITVTTLTVREYRTESVTLFFDEAKQKALAAFDAWCAEFEEGLISDKTSVFDFDSVTRTVTITGTVTVTADIALEVEFIPFVQPE